MSRGAEREPSLVASSSLGLEAPGNHQADQVLKTAFLASRGSTRVETVMEGNLPPCVEFEFLTLKFFCLKIRLGILKALHF